MPSPSNAAMLNGLCGKIHKEIQQSIAEIDNIGDIRRLNSHYNSFYCIFTLANS